MDSIDKQLLELLSKRMTIVEEIGKIKKEKGIAPLDKKRWEEVLSARKKVGGELRLAENFVAKIWNIIHKESLEREKNI